ncbi:glycoside hydrolase family 43 protein [Paludibacter jiangxiensis]|uniref:glycoside hydrolase family 43 protein n=1 Tax=Paludibacter jiangxiensis TaxID=681398 RepID=UPI001F37F49B|nr:glycoside hydrolase family 43 protein [Paludibacter jiangxiensis]
MNAIQSQTSKVRNLQTIKVTESQQNHYDAYLFVYFTGNNRNEEQIRFALSPDGYHYTALNHNNPILDAKKISLTGGVRDPHILRGIDGKTFYMVATDMVADSGWNSNRGIVLLKSTDLIHWSSKAIHIPTVFPKDFGNVLRVWAPQTVYNPKARKYMLYFSMLTSSPNEYDKIYYCYVNEDFTKITTVPKQLFYNPEKKACIDADILYAKGKYHMFYKTEGDDKGIHQAVSNELTCNWVPYVGALQQTKEHVEGPGVFKLNNSDAWILMYDVYTKGYYQFTRSTNLLKFDVVDQNVKMDFHPRHGTVMPITMQEYNSLKTYWEKHVSAESDR